MSFVPSLFDAAALYVLLPLVLLLISQSINSVLTALTGLTGMVVVNAFQFLRLKWVAFEDKVIIHRGLISVKQTVIPFSEVHDVDFVQNPIQKLFRVGNVTFQTSGDDGTVASIPFLPLAVINQLKSMYATFKTPDLNAPVEGLGVLETKTETAMSVGSLEESVATITPWENLLLSIIRPPLTWFLGLVGVIFGALASSTETIDVDFLEPYFEKAVFVNSVNKFPWISIEISNFIDFSTAIAVTLIAILVFFLVAWALAASVSFLLHQNFRLSLEEKTLHVTSGVSLRVDRKMPIHRIQMIQVVQNLRHRLLHYKSIYYDSSAPEQSSGSVFEQSFGIWLVPIIADHNVRDVTHEVMPSLNFIRDDWNGVEMRAWKRRFKRNLGILAPFVILGCFISKWIALLTIPLLALDWFLSRKYVSSISYALAQDCILVRKGWWIRLESAVPFEKIQGVVLKQTIFDRMSDMQKVCIDIAAHNSRQYAIEIPYLKEEQALELAKKIEREAQIRRFEW